jgi:hypothetical protein
VIGIVIALQIDNWNETRKTAALEIRYLKRLKTDLAQDTIYYNQRLERSRKSIDNNKLAIKKAYDIQSNIAELGELLTLYDYSSESLAIQNDTYSEMTSAGNVNIIQNESLKIAISELYRSSDQAADKIRDYDSFTRMLMTDLNASNVFLKYYPYPGVGEIFNSQTMYNDSDWEFINQSTSYKFRLLENCMLTFINKHNDFLPYFEDLKRSSITIIKMIDEELKSRNK